MDRPCDPKASVAIFDPVTGALGSVPVVCRSDEQWRRLLTPQQYLVMRQKGTERAFSNQCPLPKKNEQGLYTCVGCGTALFRYSQKFESSTGWPSFFEPIAEANIRLIPDPSLGMHRTEVVCARCGSHIGHVFDDGPPPTGKRYCINAVALQLVVVPAVVARETAVFAAGCFWGVESAFRQLVGKGVIATRVGYTGGTLKDPTYERVCSDTTGHAEAVEVTYDPAVISYDELLAVFWGVHDPTAVNRQGVDVGSQYRSAIFYLTPQQRHLAQRAKDSLAASKKYARPIATEITAGGTFYPAEDYHQQYYEKKGIPAVGCPISVPGQLRKK